MPSPTPFLVYILWCCLLYFKQVGVYIFHVSNFLFLFSVSPYMEDTCPELLPQSSLHLKHEELSPPPYSNMYPSPPVSEYDLSPHHSPVVQTPMMQHQVLCTEPTQVCLKVLTKLLLFLTKLPLNIHQCDCYLFTGGDDTTAPAAAVP